MVIYAISEKHFHLFNTYRICSASAIKNCSSTLDLNSDLFSSMIYIERHIAGSLNLEMYVRSESNMVFSEYKRRLIFNTHLSFKCSTYKNMDFKIRSTRKPTVCSSCDLTHFCYCDIAKDSIGFI